MESLTAKQRLLLGFLAQSTSPLGGEEIFLSLKNAGYKISYSSIYENLSLLFALGLLGRLVLTNSNKYGYFIKGGISLS